jgi:hypothetical protein
LVQRSKNVIDGDQTSANKPGNRLMAGLRRQHFGRENVFEMKEAAN